MDNAPAQPETKLRNRNVFFVGLLSFFGGVSQDVFSPILPIYLTAVLGFDKAFVGIAEGIVTASVSISKIASGFFSDKFKKQKPIIFLGYFLSMVGRPLLAFLSSSAAILSLRLVDGIGKGIKDPPKDVLIAGSASKKTRGRSFGVARMLDTMGSVAGPIILFGLLYFLKDNASLYHLILIFSAVPLLATLAVLVWKVRELPAPPPSTVSPALPLPRSFYLFLFIILFFTLGNSSDAFLILRAKSLGVTLVEIPIIIALFNLIYALAAVPFGSLSDRIGRVPTMCLGWLAYSIVYFGFALSSAPVQVWFLYAFYGFYYAANEGVAKALLADIVGKEHRGKAFGIYGTAIGLATLPASFIAGLLWDGFGGAAPFLFGGGVSFIALLLLMFFANKFQSAKV